MSGNAAFFDHFLLRSIDRSPQRSPSSAFFFTKKPDTISSAFCDVNSEREGGAWKS